MQEWITANWMHLTSLGLGLVALYYGLARRIDGVENKVNQLLDLPTRVQRSESEIVRIVAVCRERHGHEGTL